MSTLTGALTGALALTATAITGSSSSSPQLPDVSLAAAAPENSLAAIDAPNCVSLAPNNVLATPIKDMPIHPRNKEWKRASRAGSRNLHPDFGPSYGAQPVPYGIPWQVVAHSHNRVRVDFYYSRESDDGQYPLGPDTPIEGGKDADGDRHALVIDRKTCKLFETFDTHYRSGGRSWAGSGAKFDLGSNKLRPEGWTSADAAGLPIFPLLLRWDEVRAGEVDHAIRFTVSRTDRRYVWPARHQASAANNRDLPPMGARARLRSSFDMAGYSAKAKVVLRAMKKYGVIVADNGSDWYFQGDASPKWPDGLISELKSVPAKAFVFVKTSSLKIDDDSARARQS